jgi:hypothetical protein
MLLTCVLNPPLYLYCYNKRTYTTWSNQSFSPNRSSPGDIQQSTEIDFITTPRLYYGGSVVLGTPGRCTQLYHLPVKTNNKPKMIL